VLPGQLVQIIRRGPRRADPTLWPPPWRWWSVVGLDLRRSRGRGKLARWLPTTRSTTT